MELNLKLNVMEVNHVLHALSTGSAILNELAQKIKKDCDAQLGSIEKNEPIEVASEVVAAE